MLSGWRAAFTSQHILKQRLLQSSHGLVEKKPYRDRSFAENEQASKELPDEASTESRAYESQLCSVGTVCQGCCAYQGSTASTGKEPADLFVEIRMSVQVHNASRRVHSRRSRQHAHASLIAKLAFSDVVDLIDKLHQRNTACCRYNAVTFIVAR